MTADEAYEDELDRVLTDEDLVLVEVVNRVLDLGVVITGEVLISVAGVDLVRLGLSLYVSATETAEARRLERPLPRPLPRPGAGGSGEG